MLRVLNAMSALVVVVASLLLFSGHAYAHERRTVGPYQVLVGWLNEPAYVGQLNGLDLRVTDTRTTQPVIGLEKTLTADVAAGGLAPFVLIVTARFGTPGAYNGSVMPTATGSYTFRLKGKIETQDVDEKFTSGPGTFGDIEDTAAVQYPAKVPVADDLVKKLEDLRSGVQLAQQIAIAVGLAVIFTFARVVFGPPRPFGARRP